MLPLILKGLIMHLNSLNAVFLDFFVYLSPAIFRVSFIDLEMINPVARTLLHVHIHEISFILGEF